MSRKESEETLFGLELEFTGMTRKAAALIVAKTLGTNWVYSFDDMYEIQDKTGRIWVIKYDASINETFSDGSPCDDPDYSAELATPKLTLKDIELLLKTIDDIRGAGALANDSCGIHVHVDSSKQTIDSLVFLLKQMFINQDMLFSALKVNPNRARYCSELTPELICEIENIETLNELQKYYKNKEFYAKNQVEDRHRNLNLVKSFSHNKNENHLEYRFFNSTFNTPLIRAYIKFCLAFSKSGVDYVQNRENPYNIDAKNAIRSLNAKISPQKAITLKHLKMIDTQNQKRRELSEYDRRELDLYLKGLNMNNCDRRLLTAGLDLNLKRKFDGYQLGMI